MGEPRRIVGIGIAERAAEHPLLYRLLKAVL